MAIGLKKILSNPWLNAKIPLLTVSKQSLVSALWSFPLLFISKTPFDPAYKFRVTTWEINAIINNVKQKYPSTKIVLVGMQIPPNMGQKYTSEFKNIFPDLAKKNSLSLVPFLLENVGGIVELNQSDGIHPTAEGHKILAKNVWSVLAPLL